MAGYYDRDRNPNGAYGANATAAGTMQYPQTHIGNTAEYLVSGWPYAKTVTGTTTITFDEVTQWINVSAVGAPVTVTFQGGSAAFVVPAGTQTGQLELKCTKVTLTFSSGTGVSASILAGMTNIKATQYPDLSSYTGIQ